MTSAPKTKGVTKEDFIKLVKPIVAGAKVGILTPTVTGYEPHYKLAYASTLAIGHELDCPVECIDMVGQSCLPKGRNQLIYDALEAQAKGLSFDYLFLIDSDVGWRPYDFWFVISKMIKNHKNTGKAADDWRILGGNYPKKDVKWSEAFEYVKQTVGDNLKAASGSLSLDSLLAGITPNALRRAAQEFAARMPDNIDIDDDGCCDLYGLPAGWVCIHHTVFRDLIPHLPSYMDNGMEIPEWFDDRHVGPEKGGLYLGEDISFFQHVKQHLRIPTRCLLTALLTHTGKHTWIGAPIDDFAPGRD